jgi:nicotinamidase-related amidase
MTLAPLDPATALLCIDLQVATTSIPSASDMTAVIANAVRLLDAFRQRELPVVLMRADLNNPPMGRTTYDRPRPPVPQGALEFVPELQRAPADIVITRSGWSAFSGTDLNDQLRGRGVTQVVIAGLATNFGVESTARAAYDLDYNVVVVVDAVNNPTAEGHELSLRQLVPALGQTGTTEEILALL